MSKSLENTLYGLYTLISDQIDALKLNGLQYLDIAAKRLEAEGVDKLADTLRDIHSSWVELNQLLQAEEVTLEYHASEQHGLYMRARRTMMEAYDAIGNALPKLVF